MRDPAGASRPKRRIRSPVPVLAANNVAYSIGHEPILREITLSIEPGERLGLVGRNGAGKSTLLKIIGGLLKPDEGAVNLAKGARTGYLRQDPVLDSGETLRGEAEAAFAELHEIHRQIDDLYHQLAEAPEERTEPLLTRLAVLERDMEAKGGFAVGHRIEATLHGLGFDDEDFKLPVPGLSGGQRSRVSLAKLLLGDPDVLLLDEPTNHLDVDGCEWLEQFLSEQFRGSLIMVTHDRYMLDRVVNRIIEIEQGRLIDYPGNYDKYRELRAERQLTQSRAYEKQQTKFRQEEAFIRKYKAGQRAKQARGRESRLERERQEALERPAELQTFKMNLAKPARSGDIVASMREGGVIFNPDDQDQRKALFRELNLIISRGERWGVVGPNGVGKTTLVRALLGELQLTEGSAKLGTNVQVGYFRQIDDDPDADRPVYEYLQRAIRRENPALALSEQAARDLAGAFLFSGREQDKPLNEMSGGERARARLAALLASAKNLLVLDEPTNHLDIPSAERLEASLRLPSQGGAYEGTLILISHDRALIDAVCDNLLIFDHDSRVTTYAGNYSQWRRSREERAAQQPRPAKAEPKPAQRDAQKHSSGGSLQPETGKSNRFSWMPLEKIEKAMSEAGKRIEAIDEELVKPEVYADKDRFQSLLDELETRKSELEELEEQWLKKAE